MLVLLNHDTVKGYVYLCRDAMRHFIAFHGENLLRAHFVVDELGSFGI